MSPEKQRTFCGWKQKRSNWRMGRANLSMKMLSLKSKRTGQEMQVALSFWEEAPLGQPSVKGIGTAVLWILPEIWVSVGAESPPEPPELEPRPWDPEQRSPPDFSPAGSEIIHLCCFKPVAVFMLIYFDSLRKLTHLCKSLTYPKWKPWREERLGKGTQDLKGFGAECEWVLVFLKHQRGRVIHILPSQSVVPVSPPRVRVVVLGEGC